MRLLEFQGKELFKQYGLSVPEACLVNSRDEVIQAAAKLGYPLVLKSQLTVGGRGKAGAILKCNNESELLPKFDDLINKEEKANYLGGFWLKKW